ncbi:carboxylesterase/lipase family protein [Streptomyces sp. NPDC056405]|uniref:carboxylesterase/lipase family protein n=1 Tax=Streptomyces sp. NPDC056405 TaxID=3345811 RepID=UPI0035D708F6
MAEPTNLIQTHEGPVRGFIQDNMRQFLGIPYAAPPVGDLRWRPPEDPATWTDALEATKFGNVCAQDTSAHPGFGYSSDSEDCLYLNVFTPVPSVAGESLPVMVWIPGGGLTMGGSDSYDPSALVVDGGVVFVSFNFRLNIFGFFSHPALNNEGHAAGNYGIMDQQAALRWVQRNIWEFGGDPENVTLFGESAGAVSTLANIASPASAGLFHKAILQSCGSVANKPTATLESQEGVGQDLASAAGCHDQSAASLRTLTARELLAVDAMPEGTYGLGRYHIGLVVDGIVIPEPMSEIFSSGRFNRVPLINGVNRDEFTWFQAMMENHTGRSVPNDRYSQALEQAVTLSARSGLLGVSVPPDAVPEILARYPVEHYENASRALAAVLGDCGFISIGGRRTSRMIKKFVPSVFTYEWDVPDSPVAWPPASFSYDSGHVQELQYIFPRFCGGGGKSGELSASQKRLARQMVQYWTNFARTGDPNSPDSGAPSWPVYEPEKDNFMALRIPDPAVATGFSEFHHCDFWEQFPQ